MMVSSDLSLDTWYFHRDSTELSLHNSFLAVWFFHGYLWMIFSGLTFLLDI